MTRRLMQSLQALALFLCVCIPVFSAVHWTHTDNVSVSGASIQKTSGCAGCYDAFAEAGQRVGTMGYLEFTIPNPAPLVTAGLSQNFTPGDATSVDFGIRVQQGIAEVRENGVYRADIAAQPGAVFRISISGGTVRYFKDGFQFYSGPASGHGLSAGVLFADLGAAISNVTISNGP